MTISANFPSIRPSLLLDFASTKALDPRVTFSRPTTATYYDNHTTVVAEQNLVQYSQDYTQSSWTKVLSSTTSNVTAAPDGTTTASKLIESTATGVHEIYATTSAIATSYTYSIYAKAAERTVIRVSFVTGSFALGGSCLFDLSAGTASATTNYGATTGTTASISTITTNGFYRCSITVNATATTYYPAVDLVSGSSTTSYTGDGTSGVYIWGAQLEQRSTATAYQVTTTAPITNYIPVLLTQQSNEARFDHNPTTRESLGLLIEEQRTNLLTYSNSLGGTNWTVNTTYVGATLNSNIAPDGTQTASTITDTSASGGHNIGQNVSVTAGTTYTMTAYGKANTLNFVWLKFSDGTTNWGTTFNLSTGVVGATLSGFSAPTSTSITSVGNGWYRCSITMTAGVTGSGGMDFGVTTTSGLRVYVGTGQSAFIWGAQLEAGAFATSYIPTVASQVTRSADSASMTGTNFSSWFTTNQGTFYSEQSYYSTAVSTFTNWCTNFSGTNNTMFAYQYGGTQAINTVGGSISNASVSANTFVKYCSAYTTSSISASKNGLTTVTGAGGVAIQNQLLIGNTAPNTNTLNGYMKKLAYYPIACTSAQLQALTGN